MATCGARPLAAAAEAAVGAERLHGAGLRQRRRARKGVQLAIPMAVTLSLFFAGDLGLIPSSGPLAWVAACGAALLMGTAVVGIETSRLRK